MPVQVSFGRKQVTKHAFHHYLDRSEELFVNPPPTVLNCYGERQNGLQDMKDAGVQFHEGIPESDHLKSWFPKGGLLVLDDLIVEGGR